jgi:hypothetical protein
VTGINDAGVVVGHYTDSSFANHSFLDQGGHFTPITIAGATSITATALNDAGTIAGYYTDANGIHGFTLAGTTLTTFDDPNAVHGTYLYGINNQGVLAGYYYDTNFVAHSFTLTGNNFTPITDYPGAVPPPPQDVTVGTFAQGINDSGRVVGIAVGHQIGIIGFQFDGTNSTPITVPGAIKTYARGINNAGDVVGSYTLSGNHGFVEIGGTFTQLDYNNNPSAVLTTDAYGINQSGVIGGTYLDLNAHAHGFIATPAAVPEPSTLTLAVLGALTLLAARLGVASRAGATAPGVGA